MSVSPPAIQGIHHLTAISSDAQRTVDFYTELLGQRLLAQTVDGADPASWRLAFGDETHGPGIIAFIVRTGAPRGQYGIGGVHHLAFETQDRDTLLQWKRWLTGNNIPVSGPYNRVYFESIYFTDPDGLILEIATRGPGWALDEDRANLGRDVKPPPLETTAGHRDEAAIAAESWPNPIAAVTPEMRLKRLHHITAIGSDAGRTEDFFTGILGMRTVKRTLNFDNPVSPHLYFGVGDGEPGTIVTYFAYPHGTMRPSRGGAGVTHHFGLSVPNEDGLNAWRDQLRSRGVLVSDIADHGWFHSISFQDPDGLLLEIATGSPGLASAGKVGESGMPLGLPLGPDSQKGEFTSRLRPLTVPEPAGR